jgi:hypothetical protein
MSRRRLLPLVLAALAVAPVVTGCAGLPVQQMSDARQAISAAEQAGASEHAPELLAESKRLVERAKANLNEGEYRQSREDAELAREKAIEARRVAEAARGVQGP